MYMHLVTSSLFFGTIFSQLKRSSQIRLLRSYFAVCLIGTSDEDVPLSILPSFSRTMLHCIHSPLDLTPLLTKTPTLLLPLLPSSPQTFGCPSCNQPWFTQTIIFARYRGPSASTPPTLAIPLQVPPLERS